MPPLPPHQDTARHERSAVPTCTGKKAEALDAYRKRVEELKRQGAHKADMKAFAELKHRWVPNKQHGEIPGVPIGLKLQGKGEAAILGIHQAIMKGIDARNEYACYAICISGGYVDDDDHATDGTIVYTGAGGQDKNRRQVEDQKEDYQNASLMRSMVEKKPIRVMRKHMVKGEGDYYVYEGLYMCTNYDYVESTDGPKVYKFTLKPYKTLSQKSFQVDFDPRSTGSSKTGAAGAGGGGEARHVT